MEQKIKSKNTPNVGLKDVLGAFWIGIKDHKFAFYYAIIGTALGNIVELIVPLGYKRFFDTITNVTDKASALPILVGIVLVILALNAIRWLFFRTANFAINFFEVRSMARLRETSFDYMIDHSYSFFSNNFSGALVQRVGRFVRSFEKLFDVFVFNLVPLTVSITLVIVIVARQESKIALLILVWAIITILVNYLFSTWKLKYDVASAAADSKSTGYLADVITNQNTVSSFAASTFETKGFNKVSTAQANATLLTWNLGEVMNTIQSALIVAIEFVLFYYTLKFWGKGLVTVGTFVLIQVYILNLNQKLWNFSYVIRSVYEGFADSKEMVEILKTPHEVADLPEAKDLEVNKGDITFKDVSFGFNKSRQVLEDINLTIAGGEKVAFIGPSGAGKSTLVKLLLRIYNLKEGEILIDSQDIQKVKQESLRENISLVPQDPILFHRSLMENIRYGKRDASDEEVMAAAKLAHCDEFIEVLPDKYETFVGERGIKLSGGERQRVAIARAILKNAPILVLDEATSSLDSHSEGLIQDALDKLMKGKTTIVIAHRLSTIRKMDRIVVIKNGKVEEEGSHADLIDKEESLYKTLWNLQAGGFIAE
ncbi:ABC transporter ATP-binding protein/permease [Candidatus Parcubacteria bacterium]|nr:ABC transporter ATP-binding protein/permease [Candidatus Parcubacteria bacterium]